VLFGSSSWCSRAWPLQRRPSRQLRRQRKRLQPGCQVRRFLWARRHMSGGDGRDSTTVCPSSPRPTVRHPFASLFAPPHPAAPPRPRITLFLIRRSPIGAPALAGPLPPHRLFSSLRLSPNLAARYPPTPLPPGPPTHRGRRRRNRRRRLPRPPAAPNFFGGGGWT